MPQPKFAYDVISLPAMPPPPPPAEGAQKGATLSKAADPRHNPPRPNLGRGDER
jgi:hypothetical protein